jgi:hypothetical protein
VLWQTPSTLLRTGFEDKADQAAEWVKRAMITGTSGLLDRVPVDVEVVVCPSYAGQD